MSSLFRNGNVMTVENAPWPAHCWIAKATARAIRNCGTSLPRPVSPRLRRFVTFTQSSAKPTAPTPTSAASAIQTNRFERSIQSSVAEAIASTMRSPPIVGTPAFARWELGPSCRIDCAIW